MKVVWNFVESAGVSRVDTGVWFRKWSSGEVPPRCYKATDFQANLLGLLSVVVGLLQLEVLGFSSSSLGA